ncbi:MAG: transglutaminase-like domain-containing protein, partial [Dokdonella sp.]
LDQVFAFAGTPVRNAAWVDAERDVHKLTMPAIGVDLTLIECGKACATAPNQDTNIFDRTLMDAPRALSRAELSGGLRYTLSPRAGGAPLHVPETSEQSARVAGKDLVVEVHASARKGLGGSPDPADYMPNDWLQSAAPEIIELSIKATKRAKTDAERMHALESFVAGFISNKNLGVGYASALQVARNPQGDCTEHAVLLAALGRALGIATRVVDGLAYAPGFAGHEHVFVPHAWVYAWVDERWQSFDAALGSFDAGHIAFSSGDGDPWRFYQGLDLLGRIDLKRVEALEPQAAK